ncbi:MAG: hypothetical protein M1834_003551 [Cirrosporium novae-zelandiae]|nr:MAG: hypothetical protein M1834_003551 [Cirrosporium novae-zelandiae]
MDKSFEACVFLASLLGKHLRVHTTDTRMFIGDFKCTDQDCNIILSGTHEYRHPSPSAIAKAAAEQQQGGSSESFRLDMTSRYMGMVVVPGKHITKIELEG